MVAFKQINVNRNYSITTATKNQHKATIHSEDDELHESVKIQSYIVTLWSYFWSVFSCIRTENRKIRTRNISVFEHFSRSDKSYRYTFNVIEPMIAVFTNVFIIGLQVLV